VDFQKAQMHAFGFFYLISEAEAITRIRQNTKMLMAGLFFLIINNYSRKLDLWLFQQETKKKKVKTNRKRFNKLVVYCIMRRLIYGKNKNKRAEKKSHDVVIVAHF
jgi:hypothetical protein